MGDYPEALLKEHKDLTDDEEDVRESRTTAELIQHSFPHHVGLEDNLKTLKSEETNQSNLSKLSNRPQKGRFFIFHHTNSTNCIPESY
ncbi:hypothetical protein AB9P05_19395 [Roseivirga sp. BDSF3-8]|uniref:hypothetical protein n=1 Tax=Roseivirga sp. BDSF3-8 TaxID=3241598 RepID=UPI00353247BE